MKLLELGTGYGSLRAYVEAQTRFTYTGVDAVPRLPGVLQTTPQGTLPRSFVEGARGTFSYVVSTNVFQHLSALQRAQYVRDAAALLHEGGLFIFNLTVDTGSHVAHTRDADGNAWAVHYGQYTPIPKGAEAYDLASRELDVLYVTQRYDGLFNFVCSRSARGGERAHADRAPGELGACAAGSTPPPDARRAPG